MHFKYERLGVFCFMCGIIGHTEQFCEKLLDLNHVDGVRVWGLEIRVENRRMGGGGDSRWLREEGEISEQ